ncbi:MAG: hypothetical protein M1820_007966 [Bogoriella megaspora]|nr:MAG: hypothetical protein M1820_007966 [Bogoriella megaspora]
MSKILDRAVDAGSATIKPALLAYSLGYLSTAGPAAVKILVAIALKKRNFSEALDKFYSIFRQAASINRFPAFCGTIVAGSLFLQLPLQNVLQQVASHSKRPIRTSIIKRAARVFSSFLAAWLSFVLINTSRGLPATESNVNNRRDVSVASEFATPIHKHGNSTESIEHYSTPPNDDTISSEQLQRRPQLAGKSIDLTIFAAVRALDIIIGSIWHSKKRKCNASSSGGSITDLIGTYTDPAIFATSCSIIMWSWFYSPERLPRSYNLWISSAAQVDERLIEALRQVRYGNFVYGKDTGIERLLGSMCEDYNWPIEWGDPAKTIPIPCEMVHMGSGPSCEKHAAARFARAWLFAARMYFPLNLLMAARRRRITKQQALRTLLDAGRSSAFLSAFIALFYYGVCLARTRLGPRVFSRKSVTPMQWDGGLCVGAGCLLCGWSVLFEKPPRRQELALFVAPRAAATVLPRRYGKKHQWKEHLIFALSTATVLTAVQENPDRVRGVFGRLLHQVLSSSNTR